ncbi:MAG: efflux RND transporter periplasmic adaptor subunit [Bryobacterales bacterium]|nr:efflux RND transporter periplasmic adaptor subunit [Bryobacterales bacterium]
MATNGKRKSRRWIWILVVLTVLVGGGVAVSSAFRSNPTVDPAKLSTVETGDLARSVVATGKIEPLTKVQVKSKASGIVKKLYVEYGEQVRRGQLLADLDKEELEARVREQRAAVQAAEASLQSAEASLQRNLVEAENPESEFLKRNVQRTKELYAQKLVAQSTLDETERLYQMTLNKQAMAQRNVGVSRAEVSKAKAMVAQFRAALERAEEDLRNSTIVSPMDGLVLSRDVEVGDAVSSILVLGSQATLVMTLGDVSDVYVLGKVDEADIGKVYLGQPARIVVESFKDKKYSGKVTKISPLGVEKDNVTTFEVRVSIANPGGELKANMTANAEVILEEKTGILLVPEAAVVYDANRKTFVDVPDAASKTGKKRVPVELGISNGVKTELASGLKDGDRIILQ